MDTEITKEQKLWIIDQKLLFLNEAIYNYDLELDMFAVETGVDPDREPVQDIRTFKANALLKLEVLEAKKQEVLSE